MMKIFVRYFLNGLLLVLPACFTIYLIYSLLKWIDKIIPGILNIEFFPGLGLLIIVTFIALIGFIGSTIVARPAFNFLESYLYKIPLINLIYSSSKDVIGAFVGDKKKFNHPVLVKMNDQQDIYRVGFITREKIDISGMDNMIAVYFPDSYGFTGNLFFVNKSQVKEIDVPSSEIMKLVVSGGVSGLMPSDETKTDTDKIQK